MSILSRIQSPADLKGLTLPELETLCGELREKIIAVTEKNGGHLSSNLGAIELTVALHRVMNCPKDKLLFDVGHQAYAHKLLTGRLEAFASLRQQGGLSGFPRRDESEYDAFGAGHSGTAISAALGLVRAREMLKDNYCVAAVVGDGSFMNGPNIEAFNDAGQYGKPLLVILNDNEMSIDKNVGALSHYLSNLRTKPGYQRAKNRTKNVLARLPGIGRLLTRFIQNEKRLLRRLFLRGELFEDLGFTYLGPVDGHDMAALLEALEAARQIEKPVLLHVRTVKGYGYAPAQAHPDDWHAVSPAEGEKEFSYAGVVGNALLHLGGRDEKLCVITAAMRKSTGTEPFSLAYPERFIDVGIAESHAVTMSAALAAAGLHPHFVVYSTFLQRGYDQLIHDVALQDLPVRFLVSHTGLVGQDGATHAGSFTLSYLLQIPGMTVLVPKDAGELSYLLDWIQDHTQGPCALCYGKFGKKSVGQTLPMEQAAWPCLSDGQDVALLCTGSMVHVGLEAAQKLKTLGIRAAVYDARILKPLPEQARELLGKYDHVVTIEENVLQGGFGSELRLLKEAAGVHTLNLGLPDSFVPHASYMEQLEMVGLTPEQVCLRVYGFMQEKV